ncbi:MAG: hypothetical protein D6743_05885 [Calditrichaeota bacterium]|nr:MAG: hypothetical protein D6743_05885 [Calditrichota bacterium]
MDKISPKFFPLHVEPGSKSLPVNPAAPQPEDKKLEKLKRAAQDFEAILIAQLLRSMRRSMPESSLFGSGVSGDIYGGMFDESIAKAVARKGGFHLADIIVNNLREDRSATTGPTGMGLDDYRLRKIRPLSRPQSRDWDRSIIQKAADRHGVDPRLIEAIIRVESNYRPDAVSAKGAAGLMQLMRGTAEALGVRNRFDPEQNVFAGTKYIRQLLDRFDGDVRLALGAYNAGPQAVEKYKGVPPYKETREYVEKVLRAYEEL